MNDVIASVGLSMDQAQANRTPREYSSLYTKLIENEARDSWLFHRRAAWYARSDDWRSAQSDYVRVTELEPKVFLHWFARGVADLMNDVAAYQRTCHQAFGAFGNAPFNTRRELIVLCSLSASSEIVTKDLRLDDLIVDEGVAKTILAARDWQVVAEEYVKKSTLPLSLGLRAQSIRLLGTDASELSALVDQPEKLLPAYDRLIALHDKYAGLYYRRGMVHARLNDWTKATHDFSLAAELKPNSIWPKTALPCSYLMVDDNQNYQKLCQNAVTYATSNYEPKAPMNTRVALLCLLGNSGIKTQEIHQLWENSQGSPSTNSQRELVRLILRLRQGIEHCSKKHAPLPQDAWHPPMDQS